MPDRRNACAMNVSPRCKIHRWAKNANTVELVRFNNNWHGMSILSYWIKMEWQRKLELCSKAIVRDRITRVTRQSCQTDQVILKESIHSQPYPRTRILNSQKLFMTSSNYAPMSHLWQLWLNLNRNVSVLKWKCCFFVWVIIQRNDWHWWLEAYFLLCQCEHLYVEQVLADF